MDDTSSAQAEFYLQSVSITLPVLGNVNNNPEMDLADAILRLQILTGVDASSPGLGTKADVNGNQVLGLEEILFVLGCVAGLR